MKWTVFAVALVMILTFCAAGLPNQYSTSTSGGAPAPVAPTSPDSLGLQAPSTVVTSLESPSSLERSQGVMATSQQSAYSAAPRGLGATANSPVYNQVIGPGGGYAANNLYVYSAPQTVVSCNLYANLMLWMKTASSGTIWFYEWYPGGTLNTQYAGSVYSPGWYKRWFFADVPGWHILQYYCSGWSNYAYVYVYGPGGYWVNPTPNPEPMPYPYPYGQGLIVTTYPATGHTYHPYKTKITF